MTTVGHMVLSVLIVSMMMDVEYLSAMYISASFVGGKLQSRSELYFTRPRSR